MGVARKAWLCMLSLRAGSSDTRSSSPSEACALRVETQNLPLIVLHGNVKKLKIVFFFKDLFRLWGPILTRNINFRSVN